MAAETEAATLPETVDIAGAVALMADADHDADDAGHAATPEAALAPDAEHDTGLEGSDEEPEAEPQPEAVAADDVPEFWSAEDKAAWKDVPEGLRPIIAKYEQQRIAFVNEKTREAAQVREEAMKVAQGAAGVVEQAAAWWQHNGPAFQQAFADKWSQVDWNKLAGENPAEWTRLKQQRDNEAALLAEANRRGQADMAIANQRAAQAFAEAKRAGHHQVAGKYPDHFGTPDKAKATYDRIGLFLHSHGIPAERINAIHEASIIEIALKAMRFDEAQKKASAVTAGGGTTNTTGNATPTRVAPGPVGRTGNRNTDAARQVGERFRRNGGASIADAAELIRLNDL